MEASQLIGKWCTELAELRKLNFAFSPSNDCPVPALARLLSRVQVAQATGATDGCLQSAPSAIGIDC